MLHDKLKLLKGLKSLISSGSVMIRCTIAIVAVSCGARVTILDALIPLYGGIFFNLKDIKDVDDIIKEGISDYEVEKKLIRNQDAISDLAAQVTYTNRTKDPFFTSILIAASILMY